MNVYTLKDHDLILDINLDKERKYVLKLKDLPDTEKPRERLAQFGPEALSIHELLAIVLHTGTKKEGVLEMSSRILKEYGQYTLFRQTDVKKMASDLTIPIVKATQIIACGEIGKRFFEKRMFSKNPIRTAKDVYNYLSDMRDLPKEHFRGIYLNAHYKVIHDETISIGTINSNMIHPREVFRPAIENGAAAVIVAHNHPSGIITPSQADIEITKQLVEASKIIGIHLIDHVIIGRNKFVSINIDYS